MFTVFFSRPDFDFLRDALFTPDDFENAAFALCGSTTVGDQTRLFVRQLMLVPLEAYVERTGFHLEVSPRFINRVIDRSEARFSILTIHSHPGELTSEYSASDDFGEERLFKVFSDILPKLPHASLLFSPRGITGRYWTGEDFRRIDRVRIADGSYQDVEIGKQSKLVSGIESRTFQRQILVFGREGQTKLRDSKVGIVGLGGTGSCVAEQLVRLGVRDFLLVDNDRFEASNLTRMYGALHNDIQRRDPKTRIIARHLRSIEPEVKVREIEDTIVRQSVLMQLRDRDIVFSCTDNDWSRSVLNRFAYQYFVPVINLGMRIVVSEDKQVIGSAGRVSLVGNGLPCLLSLHRLDSERVRVESMSSDERTRLQKENYIEGLQVTGPSVVSVNSAISSLAVTMFLGMISDFSKVPSRASEQIYDALEGIVFTSKSRVDANCKVCGSNGLKGLGDSQIVSAYE